jgi:hypothetical protein
VSSEQFFLTFESEVGSRVSLINSERHNSKLTLIIWKLQLEDSGSVRTKFRMIGMIGSDEDKTNCAVFFFFSGSSTYQTMASRMTSSSSCLEACRVCFERGLEKSVGH